MVNVIRGLGVITAAYSAALVVRPDLLAKPAGFANAAGHVPAATTILIRSIGARDTAIGVAMVLAEPGAALRTAVTARVVSDLADAAVFGSTLPDRDRRPKVAGFALMWALVCGVAGVLAERR